MIDRWIVALALVLAACSGSSSPAELETTGGGEEPRTGAVEEPQGTAGAEEPLETAAAEEPQDTAGTDEAQDAAGTDGPEGSGESRVRRDLVCTEALPSGEAECTERGCSWQAPLFCTGVQPPREQVERIQRDATRACTCVCRSDLDECMRRP